MIKKLKILTFILLISIVGYKTIETRILSNNVSAEINKIQTSIASEQKRTEEIKSREEIQNTPEYKKQIAKERIGLIEDGDILFKEKRTFD